MNQGVQVALEWRRLKLVPLGRTLSVTSINVYGVDRSRIPFREDGLIKKKDLKEAMKFFQNDEDPGIDVILGLPDDEKLLFLITVTIIQDDGTEVDYRSPMIMHQFLLDVGTGVMMNRPAALWDPTSTPLMPCRISFSIDRTEYVIDNNVRKLLALRHSLTHDIRMYRVRKISDISISPTQSVHLYSVHPL
ncbi:hypothetical protein EDD21DRAFT_356286 [Dissophora ornata]|nr:hypothetical protein BGZ58_008339 [Dissophora ornata]KAI8598530.1 hypothetical protein EDD21DRAFT_356286 [Dissophora ornata]